MAKCAPNYRLTKADNPVHKYMSCAELEGWKPNRADARLLGLRALEKLVGSLSFTYRPNRLDSNRLY